MSPDSVRSGAGPIPNFPRQDYRVLGIEGRCRKNPAVSSKMKLKFATVKSSALDL